MPTAAGAKTAFAHEFHGKTDHTMQVILYKKVYELCSASTCSLSRRAEIEWDIKRRFATRLRGKVGAMTVQFSLSSFL